MGLGTGSEREGRSRLVGIMLELVLAAAASGANGVSPAALTGVGGRPQLGDRPTACSVRPEVAALALETLLAKKTGDALALAEKRSTLSVRV